MKQVSIKDLKARLSATLAEVEAGASVLVSRHGRAVARLGPVDRPFVRRGRRVGEGRLTPVLSRGTKGRALAALLEDRGER